MDPTPITPTPNPPTDAARTRDALMFYVQRVTWATSDRKPGGERDQYMRLLEEANRRVHHESRGESA